MAKKKKTQHSHYRRIANSHAAIAVAAEAPGAVPAEVEPTTSSAGPRVVSWAIPALFAVLGSINSLWDGFVSDDSQQILNNALIRQFKNIPFAFTNSVWSFATSDIIFSVDSYYRPLFNVLLTINYAIWGERAWGWHLASVLVHAGVTLLLFKVLLELTQRRWLAMASASLFAVHPAHAESVAWISGVTDPSMALFVLPAFLFYLRYRGTRRKLYCAATLAAYFLALLCKETALAFPLIILYCELIHFSDAADIKTRVRNAIVLVVLLSVPTLVYFALRYIALGSALTGTGPRYAWIPALMTIPLAAAKYLRLMFVPWGYSYMHLTYFQEKLWSASVILPALLLIVLALGVILSPSRLLKFAAAWFIIWLAPALAALRHFDPEYVVQERYLYLPSMGCCLAIALGIEWLARRRILSKQGWTKPAWAILGVTIAVLSLVYFRQNRTWMSTLSAFQNCVAVEPYSAQAESTLAGTYFTDGNPREAEAHARRAIDLNPQFVGGYVNMSFFSKQYGKMDQAIQYLEQAISTIKPAPINTHSLATAYLNLGLLYCDRKDFEKGEDHLKRSVDLWSRAVGWYYLGNFFVSRGRYEEAVAAYEKSVRMAPPRYAPVHLSLAVAYEGHGKLDDARAEYSRYLQLALPNAPDRADVKRHLADISGTPNRK